MAIFNKPDQQPAVSKPNSTVISSNTRIKGTINSDCTLQINGFHEGLVKASGAVIIGSSGKMDGDVVANRLTVTGLFHGIADCEYVEVRDGGSMRGKVISNNLTIDQNCGFEGESVKRKASKPNLEISPTQSSGDSRKEQLKTTSSQTDLSTNISASKNTHAPLHKSKAF